MEAAETFVNENEFLSSDSFSHVSETLAPPISILVTTRNVRHTDLSVRHS